MKNDKTKRINRAVICTVICNKSVINAENVTKMTKMPCERNEASSSGYYKKGQSAPCEAWRKTDKNDNIFVIFQCFDHKYKAENGFCRCDAHRRQMGFFVAKNAFITIWISIAQGTKNEQHFFYKNSFYFSQRLRGYTTF